MQELYNNFLHSFPESLQPFISIAVAGLLLYGVWSFIKKNFIGIVILIVLLPASIPILKMALMYVIQAFKYILNI